MLELADWNGRRPNLHAHFSHVSATKLTWRAPPLRFASTSVTSQSSFLQPRILCINSNLSCEELKRPCNRRIADIIMYGITWDCKEISHHTVCILESLSVAKFCQKFHSSRTTIIKQLDRGFSSKSCICWLQA